MEPMSQQDSDVIMDIVQQALMQMTEAAVARLVFPVKINVTSPQGLAFAASQEAPGADLVYAPIEEVTLITFPLTVTIMGKDRKRVQGVINQPERITKGNA